MGEHSTRIDLGKNRIYINFSGYLTLERATKLQKEYCSAVEQCSSGFTVLTNATDFKPGTPEVQDIVLSMSKMADSAGCKKVARVVGDRPLGGMQIDRLARSVATYEAQNFETFEEAEAYLDLE
jgi:hypothetical protein